MLEWFIKIIAMHFLEFAWFAILLGINLCNSQVLQLLQLQSTRNAAPAFAKARPPDDLR